MANKRDLNQISVQPQPVRRNTLVVSSDEYEDHLQLIQAILHLRSTPQEGLAKAIVDNFKKAPTP